MGKVSSVWKCPVKMGMTIRREDNIQGTREEYLLYFAQTLVDPSTFSLVFYESLEPMGFSSQW